MLRRLLNRFSDKGRHASESSAGSGSVTDKLPQQQFLAVTIHPMSDCCLAVKHYVDIRFLVDDAPLMPLDRCDRSERCKCRYRRYGDRRDDARRLSDTGLFTGSTLRPDERRESRGRREDDKP